MTITPHLFEAFLKCPTKCWLRQTGEPAAGNVYAEWTRARDEASRVEGIKRLVADAPEGSVALSPPPENLKTATWRLATDVAVHTANAETRIPAVERMPSEVRGKAAQFVPVRFVWRNKLHRDDKLSLAFDALALSEALGCDVPTGKIVHGNDSAVLNVKVAPSVKETRELVAKNVALLSSTSPPDLVLNRHCAECEFQIRCRKIAVEKDDLSLLGGMSAKERQKLRSKGIFTVNQLSYTFRPRRTPKRAKNPAKPRYLALQALAIRENATYIHGTPTLPQAKTRVFLDIEGLPDRDFYYLIGVSIISQGCETFQSYWADTPADEAALFAQFVETVCQLEDFRVFHFGDYEVAALKRKRPLLSEIHRQKLDVILGKCTNVLSALYPHVYFPTHSNGLKDIGKFVGPDRSSGGATGLHSVVWRHDWEVDRTAEQKSRLLGYNQDDCTTLRQLTDFLATQTAPAPAGLENGAKIRRTEDLPKARPRWCMFSPIEYALEDLRHIVKCGYFDYQREKVFVKTHRYLQKINKRRRREPRHRLRASMTVDFERKKCPICGAKPQPIDSKCKYTFDLKFSRSGVKRVVTCFRCWTYKCAKCEEVFDGHWKFSTKQVYGHNLMSWCVYFNVACGLNMLKVQNSLKDLFDLSVGNACRFKRYVAADYASLNDEIRRSIVGSSLIHIDETTVNVRSQTGYVWVVTTMDLVHFFYRPSREASFLPEMLDGFSGVLVSDFFTGYDSVRCLQQKCLVHLVRELDEDLVHNPFNEQFKTLAQGFGSLLRPIIETVDRYGLKKRNLGKHMRDVERFLKSVDALTPDSELVGKYRNRFIKYWARMFTFLDHDGVPWNNNNAEHAIKRFAKYRRNADGRYTESSLKDYLVLASVLETCDFNRVNVLQFLLSKERTLEGLLRMAGRSPLDEAAE